MENLLLYLSTITAFLMVLISAPILIPLLRRLKFGQMVRDDGPSSHLKKQGTPTMGGIMIMIGIVIGTLVFVGFNKTGILLCLTVIGYGGLGFLDDFIKIIKKRSMGLRAKEKLLGQIVLALLITVGAYYVSGSNTEVMIPFFNQAIDFGWFWFPFTMFVLIAMTNAVNLTDGLDGLASGVSLVVAVFFVFFMEQLHLYDLSHFAGTIAGACVGFLIYNFYPAKVFMGDTGSLALGGALSIAAILSGAHFYVAFVGLVFVWETFSVALQVLYFKATKGKRIFKMAPYHHHLELSGLTEKQIFSLFFAITAGLAVLFYFV